ncbi:hypothetical protein Adeg_0807 [Ammonifex degensii KC4]|uniref:CRISPR type III-B/RAMP module-associated protein Cmr5 n=1 Tax=Ammonifex degensii (strain DSM 10501 / KC4) TaxID=429009 RepID=C9RCH2_AMMDK|nr:hypothetical protein [Ammonifex degensii]ACX51949.1 hypothetical protein Adeg_0807 [Ammonifex degensii KC4]
MVNLDREALRAAQELLEGADDEKKVTELENHLTKGLGILTESGVYALFLYLLAKREKDKGKGKKKENDPCRTILERLFGFLRNNSDLLAALGLEKDKLPGNVEDAGEVLSWASEHVGDLDRLLLLRDFLLRALTCGRYIAEARKAEFSGRKPGGGRSNP